MDWDRVAKTLGIGVAGAGKTYFPYADETLKERKLQAKDWDVRYSLFKNVANQLGIDFGEEPQKEDFNTFASKVLSNEDFARKYNIPIQKSAESEVNTSTIPLEDKINKVTFNDIKWNELHSRLKNPVYNLVKLKQPFKVQINANETYTVKNLKDFIKLIETRPNLVKKIYRLKQDPNIEFNKLFDEMLSQLNSEDKSTNLAKIQEVIKQNPEVYKRLKKAYADYLKDYYKKLNEYRKNIFWKIPDLKTELYLMSSQGKAKTGGRLPSYVFKTNYKDYFKSINQKFKNLFNGIDNIKSSLVDKNLENTGDIRSFIQEYNTAKNNLLTQANSLNTSYFSKVENPYYWKPNRAIYTKYVEGLTNAYTYPLSLNLYASVLKSGNLDKNRRSAINSNILNTLRNSLIYQGLFKIKDSIKSIQDMRDLTRQLLYNYFKNNFDVDTNNIKDKNFKTIMNNSLIETIGNLENQYVEGLKKIMELKGYAIKQKGKPTKYDVNGFKEWLKKNGF